MKISKFVYLLLGIVMLADLVYAIVLPEETYRVMFWEVNVWIYRVYSLALVLACFRAYMERRKAEKLNSY